MDYIRQVEEIVDYIRKGEKTEGNLKIGAEFEHFVIDLDTYETVSYYGDRGVNKVLSDLEANGWEGYYEGEYLLALSKGDKTITLEPGSQLEFSSRAEYSIRELEDSYIDFLKEINQVLDKYNYSLAALGYHPVTKIDQIRLLPKKRYDYMYDYFKTKGTCAHNMMKGTAAFQVTIDYTSEADYKKKYKLINGMSPVLYGIFDNSYYFEGGVWDRHNLRAYIWNNCDDARSGLVPGTMDLDFSYEDYARYILNIEPIFIIKDGQAINTGSKQVRDIFDPENYSQEDLDHIMTMVFPDVRTKKYIEVRMMDSVPYPYNMSIIGFLKGILYNKISLDKAYELIKDFTDEDIIRSKESIIQDGLRGTIKGEPILDFSKKLLEISKAGLEASEQGYLYPMEALVNNEVTLQEISKKNSKYGLDQALEPSLLKDIKE